MGALISLLHATRGRAVQAAECRRVWLRQADDAARVEHLFAVDDDDQASLAALSPEVIVPDGGGCVRAWNEAARRCQGKVLVQLSDDWIAPEGWDTKILRAFGDLDRPAVLRISDGARRDQLLCMAILTRARLDQMGGELFCPEYKSLFSDTEFSYFAYRDGVVIDARHIQIEHRHPIFGKAPWDETYRHSSNRARFHEGREIFERRNPGIWHPNANPDQISSTAW